MGRTGKILLLVFAALAGFALSFYVFFPLDGAVRTLWRDAARRAAAEGLSSILRESRRSVSPSPPPF
ncbi:hypothetical protein MASR2M17_08200 [Aminivibrio sp.]